MSYDDWGNLKLRNDGSRDLRETYTYYNHSRIKNLVATKMVENKNPLTGQVSTVTTSYVYDENLGKPIEAKVEGGPETLITYYTYYDNGNLKSRTEPNGLVTEFEYDNVKNAFPVKKTVKGVANKDGVVEDIITKYDYNLETGMKVFEIDPRGFKTSYEYDKLNRITKVTLPDDDSDDGNNPYREYQFDDDHNLCDFYNEKGQRTRFQFDGLGRLTEIIKYTDGKRYTVEVTTGYEYDSLGRIIKVTDPENRITGYDYDGLNRVVKVTYPDNSFVALEYDDSTNSVTITDEEGGKVTERSDWANRLVEANQYYTYTNNNVTETDSFTWTFAYDSLGHRLRQLDPMLQQADQEYDALGRLIKTTLPTAALLAPGETIPKAVRPQLTYEYDKMGNRIGEISANGNATGNPEKYKVEYKYDLLGRRTQVITKATEIINGVTVSKTYTTRIFYDAAGNKVRTVLPNGKECEYTYSARGWLLSETAPFDPADLSTKQITRYQYDALGNKTAVTDPRGNGTDGKFTTWYVYDDLNRLYRTILPDDTPPADPYLNPEDNPYTEITYDSVGNKTRERDANGVTTSYEYTLRNWLWKVIDGKGRVQKTYTYDKTGRPIKVKDINNQTVISAYDSLGRLRKVTDPLNNSEEYQYDKVGNRTSITDGRGNTTYYSYNSLGLITGVRQPLGNFSQYRYDLNGNRVEAIAPNNLSTKARYDELNRVVESIDSLGNSTRYRYDEVGNRSWMEDRRGTEWEYQYYANNLLQRVEATGADGVNYWVEYTYDRAGNRMKVTDSGNEIKYNFEGEAYLPDPLNRINSINRSFDGASYQTAYQYSPAGLVEPAYRSHRFYRV
jgi:YD repeat-containing protein